MKNLIIIAAVLLAGCNPNSDAPQEPLGDFVVKTIDSCEYIEYDYGYSDRRVYSLTHKGNCKYCIQRNKTNNYGTK